MTRNDAIELAKEDMYNRYGDKLSNMWSKSKRQVLHDQYEEAIKILDELKFTAIVTNCTFHNNEKMDEK
jgi:hypothetical protein